ncbi:hypothetical protein [Olivibacter jilunii]|uniref:hypothetical protein n=1 Tax=Olivibacter jilunii TaxID=985016 RepID=UPI00102FECD9|nr:hypothetical protein [Olivibacter jilunii]
MKHIANLPDLEKDFMEMKAQLEKDCGRVISDHEVRQSMAFMKLLADIVVDLAMEEYKLQGKLSKNPEGFHYDGDRPVCVICKGHASGERSWYDSNGLKCIHCQSAINQGVIPESVAKTEDGHYTLAELQHLFNAKPSTIRKMVKLNIIKERIILNLEEKKVHFRLFLLDDTPGFFPPKDLLKVGGPVKEVDENGNEEYAFYPWYYFVDPIEHLKEYDIVHYLKITSQQ